MGALSFPLETLQEYTQKRWIRSQAHPTKNLRIYNYSEITQYSKNWDNITTQCRGLVLDTDGNVVARSFNKFFNIEENMHNPTDDFVIQDKLDGSLILLFYHDNEWIVASRGSFISEQAKKAQELIDKLYHIDDLNKDYSYVFEIIYPQNRIVVNYDDKEELVFLACFQKDGTEVFTEKNAINEAGFDTVKHHHFTDYKTIKALDWENAEGFVVRFSNGDRVKIKFEQYVQLHKVVTNLSTKTVWQWFNDKKEFADCLEQVPDEWQVWTKTKWSELESQYNTTLQELQQQFDIYQTESDGNRATFAKLIRDDPHKAIYFLMLDNRPYHEKICALFKPLATNTEIAVAKPRKKTATMRQKGTITCMVGISASGKSTWARNYVQKHCDTVIVSRDALRMMCFGYELTTLRKYYDHPMMGQREVQISALQHSCMETALQQHLSVIVDDTNLKASTLNGLLKRFAGYEFKFKFMECAVEEAIARDAHRQASVGASVIHRQQELLMTLRLADLNITTENCTIQQNPELPAAYVFDIDGTLANNNGRDAFDWSAVIEDTVHAEIRDCLIALHEAGFKIIICSGRDSVCLKATSEWLHIHHIPHDELHMREQGDNRADYVVKEEFWRDIVKRHHVRAMFDDRRQVVQHARRLGFTVCQVAEGNF